MVTRGKKSAAHRATVFSPRQNRALRSALRGLKQDRKLSQIGLGRLLGIAQQNAGRLLNARGGGFSYDTATRLARELGFGGVDAFFSAKGIAMTTAPSEVLSSTGTDG